MIEFPKDVREFIARDLVFLVGGSCVVGSFLYRFYKPPDQDTPIIYYLLAAGVAYVIGYALQDGFSVLRIVTTATVKKPGDLQKWLYKRFTGDDWDGVEQLDWKHVSSAVETKFHNDFYRAAYQRAVTLMMVGRYDGSL